MRVQYTLKDATADAIKKRAEALDIHPSRLVEEYLTAALRSNAPVTLTPKTLPPHTPVSSAPGAGQIAPAPRAPGSGSTTNDISRMSFEELEDEALGER